MSNKWRRWRKPDKHNCQNNFDPSAPESKVPSNQDVIHSPKTVHLTNKNEFQSSDTNSSIQDTVITQPSGFQRFIPGGSNDRCSTMDSTNDTCPYPDVERARSSDCSSPASSRISLEEDQANIPYRNMSIRQRAFYQRRYGNTGIPLTPQQLNALVEDSKKLVNKAILALSEELKPLRRPDLLPITSRALTTPPETSSQTLEVPEFIQDHINKK